MGMESARYVAEGETEFTVSSHKARQRGKASVTGVACVWTLAQD